MTGGICRFYTDVGSQWRTERDGGCCPDVHGVTIEGATLDHCDL